MDKITLRRYISEHRKNLSPDQVNKASMDIVSTLINLPLIKESRVILSYMPHGNEVNLLPLNQWILDQGKELCLPRVLNDSLMDAAKVENLKYGLINSHFGILEPAPCFESVDIWKIDVILVPGLAFDWTGNRLGHGKGYYDRFLKKCCENTVTIGVAYSFQVFDSIPCDEHDVKLRGIVTENKIKFYL